MYTRQKKDDKNTKPTIQHSLLDVQKDIIIYHQILCLIYILYHIHNATKGEKIKIPC